jgi:hypothetical protein
MSDLKIQLPDGTELTLVQWAELSRLIDKAEAGSTHWHPNECGCCLTLHGPDYAYVIGPDGESTFFANRGCGCGGE